MLSNIQCDFLGHLHLLLHLRVTLSTHTHIVFHVVKELSQRVIISKRQGLCRIKLCGLQDLRRASNVSYYNLRSEVRCMQSVICSLQAVVCSLQSAVWSLKSANVRHRKIQHNLPAQSAKALVKLLPQFCWIICILRVSFFYLFLSAKTEHTPLVLKFVWNQLLWGVTSLE